MWLFGLLYWRIVIAFYFPDLILSFHIQSLLHQPLLLLLLEHLLILLLMLMLLLIIWPLFVMP
jgi:hypothetical protein